MIEKEYLIITSESLNWNDANEYCKNHLGTELATFCTYEEIGSFFGWLAYLNLGWGYYGWIGASFINKQWGYWNVTNEYCIVYYPIL